MLAQLDAQHARLANTNQWDRERVLLGFEDDHGLIGGLCCGRCALDLDNHEFLHGAMSIARAQLESTSASCVGAELRCLLRAHSSARLIEADVEGCGESSDVLVDVGHVPMNVRGELSLREFAAACENVLLESV